MTREMRDHYGSGSGKGGGGREEKKESGNPGGASEEELCVRQPGARHGNLAPRIAIMCIYL